MVETESSSSSSTLVVGPSEPPLLVELTAEFRGGGGRGNSSTTELVVLTGLMTILFVFILVFWVLGHATTFVSRKVTVFLLCCCCCWLWCCWTCWSRLQQTFTDSLTPLAVVLRFCEWCWVLWFLGNVCKKEDEDVEDEDVEAIATAVWGCWWILLKFERATPPPPPATICECGPCNNGWNENGGKMVRQEITFWIFRRIIVRFIWSANFSKRSPVSSFSILK